MYIKYSIYNIRLNHLLALVAELLDGKLGEAV